MDLSNYPHPRSGLHFTSPTLHYLCSAGNVSHDQHSNSRSKGVAVIALVYIGQIVIPMKLALDLIGGTVIQENPLRERQMCKNVIMH